MMHHSLIAGKLVSKTSRLLNRSASTWPGHIALKADGKIVKKVLQKNQDLKVVFIAGTNGKTTTTKALTHILENSGISVLTNQAGANLLNGLASLLVNQTNLSGKLHHKALIFEVDESSLPVVLKEVPNPNAIILLNLFRDQLDRYGEVNSTSEKWKKCIENLSESTIVIGNADDPQIANVTLAAKNHFFYTIDRIHKKGQVLSHAVDSTTCPNCNSQLLYNGISYSHLGNYVCPVCGFERPKAKSYSFQSNLQGKYNIYNLSAAIRVADKVFGINPFTSFKALENFQPAFGRQEILEIDGKKIMLLLSKNPTGFNESLSVAFSNPNHQSLLILLNDRIPDGRDISWIWDVDFEILKEKDLKVFVSGDRAYDMANRMLFANVSHEVFDNYNKAFQAALNQTSIGKTLVILPTYSAMLEIRKTISGKAIL